MISDNLQALENVKQSIKLAIESKGQDLTNVPFTQYAEKIESIQTGEAGENKLAKLISGEDISLTASDLGDMAQLPAYAFYQKNNLISVVLPDTITKINTNAFDNCTKLTSVNIPKELTLIETYGFYKCEKLTSIIFNEKLQTIRASAFDRCTGLKKVVFNSDITTIGSNAFYRCSSLEEVIFNGDVAKIEVGAFNTCNKVMLYDFSKATIIPTIPNNYTLQGGAGCIIKVPDNLYDEWRATANWDTMPTDTTASKYFVWVKSSEYVES